MARFFFMRVVVVVVVVVEFFDSHSAQDVNRLSFGTIADVLHVDDRNQQVHVESQLIKVPLAEQFDMRRQEILGNIKTQQDN